MRNRWERRRLVADRGTIEGVAVAAIFAGGMFVQAIDEALDKHFDKANHSRTGVLDSQELVAYVAHRVPEILNGEKEKEKKKSAKTLKEQREIEEILRASQTPDFFPDFGHMERYPVARK